MEPSFSTSHRSMLSNVSLVISGISGRYPASENLEELWKSLLNGTELITNVENRWSKSKSI